ncbi:MAG: Gldg family protein [Pseudomonadota bacterium]
MSETLVRNTPEPNTGGPNTGEPNTAPPKSPVSNTSIVLRVAKKEIASYFASLAGVIFIGVFLAASLFSFFWVERFFARNIADLRPLFEWMPVLLIFLISAVTMRQWSEERRSGTLEYLMTMPASPLALVIGKFIACLTLVAIAIGLTLPLPITVALLGDLDPGPVIGGYLAILCVASAYIAIGLFVSARTESQIVSLIVTALLCGIFYLIGSDGLTTLFGNAAGAFMRLLGAGARFESISRGVLDFRDIYYYLSIFGVFIALTVFTLERLRWSTQDTSGRHMRWHVIIGLAIANLIAGNLWLQQTPTLRADLTDGQVYSISDATRGYLRQLEEPLLLRGYFSAETHPLLAPLAPRLQDLMREYAVAGGGRVKVEFIDPLQDEALQEEAGRRYGVRPVPFQTADRRQASVTNSYFDIVVQYGDEYETLGFGDLIEVKQANPTSIDVELQNPEYDITRAIKKVLTSYRAAGDLWAAFDSPITLTAFISDPATLPDPLPVFVGEIDTLVNEYKEEAGDKFVFRRINPDANDAGAPDPIADYGLQPLAAGLLNPQQFWLHLVLEKGDRKLVVPLPETFDRDALERVLEGELKRFAPGALRTIALSRPAPTPGNPQFGVPPGRAQFNGLEQTLRENADVIIADLGSGRTPAQTDALVIAGPEGLDNKALFAIDQFLMRGGSVVIAASAFKPNLGQELAIKKQSTGLEGLLGHYGISLGDSLVLDTQNTPFPVPIVRDLGGFQVQDYELLDYPHFIDLRQNALASNGAPTAGLGQVTMTWASPITLDNEKLTDVAVTRLAESSANAWVSTSTTVIPDFERYPTRGYPEPDETGAQLLGVMAEGRFTSYFKGKDNPLLVDASSAQENAASQSDDDNAEDSKQPTFGTIIEESAGTARLFVYSSSSFVSDDALALAGGVDQQGYTAPLLLIENTVDWALEDRGLLKIRSRQGRFARTLLPLSETARGFWETVNYILAAIGLFAVYFIQQFIRKRTTQRRLAILQTNSTGSGS